jgi:hypothetical protein
VFRQNSRLQVHRGNLPAFLRRVRQEYQHKFLLVFQLYSRQVNQVEFRRLCLRCAQVASRVPDLLVNQPVFRQLNRQVCRQVPLLACLPECRVAGPVVSLHLFRLVHHHRILVANLVQHPRGSLQASRAVCQLVILHQFRQVLQQRCRQVSLQASPRRCPAAHLAVHLRGVPLRVHREHPRAFLVLNQLPFPVEILQADLLDSHLTNLLVNQQSSHLANLREPRHLFHL